MQGAQKHKNCQKMIVGSGSTGWKYHAFHGYAYSMQW